MCNVKIALGNITKLDDNCLVNSVNKISFTDRIAELNSIKLREQK